MDSHGLSKTKRAELLARLSDLDRLIEEQASHAKLLRGRGDDPSDIEDLLERLKKSRQVYFSALKHLLGDAVPEDDGTKPSS
jgi:hypothetical protein